MHDHSNYVVSTCTVLQVNVTLINRHSYYYVDLEERTLLYIQHVASYCNHENYHDGTSTVSALNMPVCLFTNWHV